MKSNGLSKSDTKIRMFLPIQFGGLGLISTLELDIIAVAREFEIVSNNVTIDSRTFRSRISALNNYPIHFIFTNRNHAREAIAKLAGFGIYVRDAADGMINDILTEMSTSYKSYKPFNHPQYKDSCKMGIGLGKEKNKQLMLGGPVHSILRMLKNNSWQTSDFISSIAKSYNISPNSLLKIQSKITKKEWSDSIRIFDFWDWKNSSLNSTTQITSCAENWTSNKAGHYKGTSDIDRGRRKCDECKIMWNNVVRLSKNSEMVIYNTYSWEGKILKFIMDSKSPILVATDGAHSRPEIDPSEAGDTSTTSSSFVLCIADIKEKESLESGQWIHRPVIPLLSRASILPQNFGSTPTDIAHGEFWAILMAEMALSDLPRITLTDSKAIRQQVLKIRELKGVVNDRNYIRSIAGGVGKYICGLLRELLHKAEYDTRENMSSTISPAMKKLHKVLMERNASFTNIAKSWISREPRNGKNELTGWEEQYFDENARNPIMKINSHQLDKTGTRIKDSARYQRLIPNLAVLSANHHADACADMVQNFSHKSFKWNRPPAYLRFSITCRGLNIDRNISAFCHDQFSILKIRKLRLKKTQGLLWRLLHLTSTSWEILMLHKGWLRSLLGLSSSHTRRTYKSEVYRECCKAKLIKCSKSDARLQEICSAKPAKALQLYSHCLWCSDKKTFDHKGNRNHVFLFCSNPKIISFKTRLTNLTEAKLKLFFLDLGKATNFENVVTGIRMIEQEFLDLQNIQIGRLTKLPAGLNTRYLLSIQSILEKENCSSIKVATESSKFSFFSKIFGLNPFTNGKEVTDETLGLLDSPWLGLIPLSIDKIMMNLCTAIKIFIPHHQTAESISIMLQQSWKEIKNLIMGKAIGIHRVIGSTGKQFEKDWKKEFSIDTNSIIKIKKEIKSHMTNHSPLLKFSRVKRKFDTVGFNDRSTKKVKGNIVSPDATPLKACTGITCLEKYKTWYPNNNFYPNKMKSSIKQCQRCSRFMTGIRQCQVVFLDLEKCLSPVAIQDLLDFVRLNHGYMKHKYHQLFSRMNNCLPDSSKIILEKTKRVNDRFKLIGNILCTTIKKATNQFTIQDEQTIHRSSNLLYKIISCKKLDFILDKEAEVKIQLLTNNNADIFCKSLNTEFSNNLTSKSNPKIECTDCSKEITGLPNIDTSQKPSEGEGSGTIEVYNSTCTISKPSILSSPQASKLKPKRITVQNVLELSSRHRLRDYASRIIRPNICMEGGNMMKAVEILRSYKTSGLFFATAESENLILNWQTNQGWRQFARIFGSRELIHNKMNATYLIPLFSGDTSSGHWHLCVIQKLGRRDYKAWCIDSLGTGRIDNIIAQKIKNAFSPGRGRFTWISCTCRRQEELECGPRTILAMWIIQEKLQEGLTLENAIQSATLMREPSQAFIATKIREKIANFVNKFSGDMVTAPIRFRQRTSSYRAPITNEASKNPIVLD